MKRSYSRKNLRVKSRRSKRRMNGGGGKAFTDCIALLDTRNAIKISASSQLIDYDNWLPLSRTTVLNKKNEAIRKAKLCAWEHHNSCQEGSYDANCIETLNTINAYEKEDKVIVKDTKYDIPLV